MAGNHLLDIVEFVLNVADVVVGVWKCHPIKEHLAHGCQLLKFAGCMWRGLLHLCLLLLHDLGFQSMDILCSTFYLGLQHQHTICNIQWRRLLA